MDDGENFTTMWLCLVPLKCTVKCGLNCVFYYVTFTTIKNNLKRGEWKSNLENLNVWKKKIKLILCITILARKSQRQLGGCWKEYMWTSWNEHSGR